MMCLMTIPYESPTQLSISLIVRASDSVSYCHFRYPLPWLKASGISYIDMTNAWQTVCLMEAFRFIIAGMEMCL